MINKNLYNKYRPKSFSEIVGQEIVKKLLLKTFSNQKLLQSYLFYGSHGTGKTSLARIFAKAWNCSKFLELGDVCNECKNCKLINDNVTIDICEVDSASNSGVDHVRELIQNSQYMPLDLNKKIYLIDECHNLSNSAWNALLKTIEEPSSDDVIFIFLTTNVHKVPDTILSRCQKYNFSSLSFEELEGVVKSIEQGEGRSLDEDAKKLLIQLSQGSARECVSLMEQVFLSADKPQVNLSDVENVFALANKEDQMKFLELLIDVENMENRKKLIQIVDDLVTRNIHLLNYFSSLFSMAMDLHVYEVTGDLSLMKRINAQDVKRLAHKGIDYLFICDKLFSDLQKFSSAYSKGEWAKLALLRLLTRKKSREETVARFETETINEEDLFVPKDKELKFLYNTLDDRRDDNRSKQNYTIYQELKERPDLNKTLKDVLFQDSITFPSNKMVTTDKTILLLFKDKKEADKFNSVVVSGSPFEKELNDLFLGTYFWWAATVDQMKFYKKRPKPSNEEIAASFADNVDEERFMELLNIIES